MADYLLEIGTEEIPAKFMRGVLAELEELTAKKLAEKRIKFAALRTLGTPRRLALFINGLAEKEEDLKEEVRGPAKKAAFDAIGQPTKAAQGFARSQGVAVENLLCKETGQGEYVFALKEVAGRLTEEVLPEIMPQIIMSLSFPKPMRWGEKEFRFARPIRWLVSLLEEKIIPFEIENLTAAASSRGHRFLGQQRIAIKSPQTYEEQLRENFVLVDQELRKRECWRQILEEAAKVQGMVAEDEGLLEEVTFLLEWPTALMGSFAPEYLQMPEEAVITPMREHQRYFPVRDQEGKLLPRFITVRNGNGDHLASVRAGNEKVLKARLADARFFWEEDQKVKLADYLPRLEKIVFQESLGTVAEKSARVAKTVNALCVKLNQDKTVQENAYRAAQLAKADLVTNMVVEFPELQGIMGNYYALLSGEKPPVAQAILEHYHPRFAGDTLPAGLAGALVSIADKMDTLVGCFAIGIEPTGSQDPYALRRQGMGVCLILCAHQLELKLDELISMALANYQGIVKEEQLQQPTVVKIKEFFQSRLKNLLSDQGHKYDVIEAVLSVDDGSLLDLLSRAQALSEMRENGHFQALVTAFTRAYNLTKKDVGGTIDPAYFEDASEKALYVMLQETAGKISALAATRDYRGVIEELSRLAQPINDFFVAVMVMAQKQQVRTNRLGLLARVVRLTKCMGDLSKIVL